MNQPRLEGFDLTDSTWRKWKHWEEKTLFTWVLGFIGICGVGFGIDGFREGGLGMAIFLGFVIGPTFGLGLSFPLAAALSTIFARMRPEFANYRRYDRALDAYNRWKRLTTTAHWRSLSGIQFEHAIAALFRNVGYSALVTPPSGDEGIDIVLSKGGTNFIVQCKATRSPVGPAVARELYGCLAASDADFAILASVSGVSPGGHQFIHGKPILVLALNEILEMVEGRDPILGSLAQVALQKITR
jgi:hypothetical protein